MAVRSAASYAEQSGAAQSAEARARRQPSPEGDMPLYKTWEKLKAEADKRRAPWLSTWQECYAYTLPLREGFFNEAAAQDRTDMIYDETAVVGVPKLASRLATGYFPEFGEIFSLAYGEDAPAHLGNFEGMAKLERLTQMIHSSWQNSNMGVETGEGMIDFALGTFNLLQEPGHWPGEVRFTSADPTCIALLPDGKGGVKGWFWWRKIALEDVKACYPKATFSAAMERDLKREPQKEVMVQCAQWKKQGGGHEHSYQFLVVLPDYGAKDGIIYQRVDEGEGACAWSTARWSKIGRDVWGRGPIQLVMPAVKTCNLVTQMSLENAEYAIGGMFTYDDDGVFDPESVTFAPGTFIAKSREGKIEPLQSGAQFDVGNFVLADQQQNIKRGLYIDEMDSKGDTPYSAYEAQQRRADIARDLAMPGSRLTRECIVHHVNRTIWIFEKQGLLKSLGLRVDGKRLRLIVKSPFLRGQDAIVMQEMLTGAGQMNALLGPGTSGMAFNMQRTRDEIFLRNGIPIRLANTEDEIAAMSQQAGAAAGEASAAAGPEGGGDPMAITGALLKAGQQ
jgi:hypothetical protein